MELALRVLLGLFAAANVVAQWLFLHRLRTHHAQTWSGLGKPGFFLPPFGKVAASYRRFLRDSSALRALADPQLNLLWRVIGVTGYAALVIFLGYWLWALA